MYFQICFKDQNKKIFVPQVWQKISLTNFNLEPPW